MGEMNNLWSDESDSLDNWSDLLSEDGDLVSDVSDFFNVLWSNSWNWLLSDNGNLVDNVVDFSSKRSNVTLNNGDFVSDFWNSLDKSWSFGSWNSDNSSDQFSDSSSKNWDSSDVLDNSDNLFVDDSLSLGDDGDISWSVETVVVWSQVEGEVTLAQTHSLFGVSVVLWMSSDTLDAFSEKLDGSSVITGVVTGVNWLDLSEDIESSDSSLDSVNLVNNSSDDSSDSSNLW